MQGLDRSQIEVHRPIFASGQKPIQTEVQGNLPGLCQFHDFLKKLLRFSFQQILHQELRLTPASERAREGLPLPPWAKRRLCVFFFGYLKTHPRGAQIVLRSKSPELVKPESWGLLTAHYAIRGLMHEAALQADEDPDRLSFLHSVRVVQRRIARRYSPLRRGKPCMS